MFLQAARSYIKSKYNDFLTNDNFDPSKYRAFIKEIYRDTDEIVRGKNPIFEQGKLTKFLTDITNEIREYQSTSPLVPTIVEPILKLVSIILLYRAIYNKETPQPLIAYIKGCYDEAISKDTDIDVNLFSKNFFKDFYISLESLTAKEENEKSEKDNESCLIQKNLQYIGKYADYITSDDKFKACLKQISYLALSKEVKSSSAISGQSVFDIKDKIETSNKEENKKSKKDKEQLVTIAQQHQHDKLPLSLAVLREQLLADCYTLVDYRKNKDSQIPQKKLEQEVIKSFKNHFKALNPKVKTNLKDEKTSTDITLLRIVQNLQVLDCNKLNLLKTQASNIASIEMKEYLAKLNNAALRILLCREEIIKLQNIEVATIYGIVKDITGISNIDDFNMLEDDQLVNILYYNIIVPLYTHPDKLNKLKELVQCLPENCTWQELRVWGNLQKACNIDIQARNDHMLSLKALTNTLDKQVFTELNKITAGLDNAQSSYWNNRIHRQCAYIAKPEVQQLHKDLSIHRIALQRQMDDVTYKPVNAITWRDEMQARVNKTLNSSAITAHPSLFYDLYNKLKQLVCWFVGSSTSEVKQYDVKQLSVTKSKDAFFRTKTYKALDEVKDKLSQAPQLCA